MGYQRRVHGDCTEYIQTSNMYKIAIVVCLAAAVSAEADADAALLYGAYGYTGLAGAYPYAYGAYPYAYGGYGVTNAANTVGIAGVAPAALPLLLVDMLVLADMLPTLPELSMLPRDPLMLSQRLRLMLLSSTELMDMVDTVLDMPDTDMELTHM